MYPTLYLREIISMKMNKNFREVVLIILNLFVIVLLALTIFNKQKYEIIDLNGMKEDPNIYMEITNVEANNGTLQIEGAVADFKQKQVYDNWIMGQGEKIYINYKILIQSNDVVAYVPSRTANHEVTALVDDYEMSQFGFNLKTKNIPEKSFKIGVLIEGVNGELSYVFSEKEYQVQ